jgi:hypothetical protein
MHPCTVLSSSHLARARVLSRRFPGHLPGSALPALAVDPGLGEGREPFEAPVPGDLLTPEKWGRLRFGHTRRGPAVDP